MPDESKLISEHKRKLKPGTIMVTMVVGIMFLFYAAMIGFYFYMAMTGRRMTWLDGTLVGIAVIIAGFFGVAVDRFFRRMLSVRRVLLFEDDRIGVVTWGGKLFTAKLPSQVKHMLAIGNDLTVTLQIEKQVFIVDSDQFSDQKGINDFLRRFLEQYRKP